MRIIDEVVNNTKLYEPEDFDNSIISHYALTKKNVYKKEALRKIKKTLSIFQQVDKISNEVAEHAIEQYLFDVKKDVPFPGPEAGSEDFTFIDLFAGIGGFRIALQELNGLCVFSSEWDKQSQYTYKLNFGERPFGDIKDPETKKYIPKKFDVLCAGFPCQPFSRAGVSARNSLGISHGFEDKIQGNLFFEILDIAQSHKPQVLFLENVKNLKSHDEGNTFITIEKMIKEIGYSFFSKVINAQTEVAQRRERTYMVCFKNDKIKFAFPEFKGEIKKLRTILEENVLDTYTISDNLWAGHQRRTLANTERGTGFTANIANLDKPSNTLVARYYKDGKECLIPQENNNPRMLTPRECARLQGFPENFIPHPSKTPAYKQFGNSVAVPVVQRIAEEIKKYIR